MIEITDKQAEHIIEKREIPPEILKSGDKVAVILTQDWCPQWLFMKQWLGNTEEQGIKTYFISYNRKDYFDDFMSVKESEFDNDLVPYVRYYINGEYRCDSNFVSKELFLSNFL